MMDDHQQFEAPLVGLSLMPQANFLEAAQPLLESGAVDVLEWSFDMGWGAVTLPNWILEILEHYSQRDRLLGHGVSYSLLSAQRDNTQWLDCLKAECQQYRYRQITEHFGWMAAGDFYQSAPFPLPFRPKTLHLGQQRLQNLADIAKVPVGLENLAFAFGLQDVLEQGTFLDQLLEPVDGFLLLDLHNLYCQIYNVQQSAVDLLSRYPLARVRELHISGGSWSETLDNRIRRDTHDHPVPEPVFELLTLALQQCPQVESVIFEQLGHTLTTDIERLKFREDFGRIQHIVKTVKPHARK
jgi:uncharacterized protein